MAKRTHLGLERASVSLWIILALLFAPCSPTPSVLEAPCPEHEASLRGRRLKKGILRARGRLRGLLQLLKAFLILLLFAWMLAHTRSLKELLRKTSCLLAPNSLAACSTTPCQPANTPRATPNLEHPFLKTLHEDPTVQRYRTLFELVHEIVPPPKPSARLGVKPTHEKDPKTGKKKVVLQSKVGAQILL